MANPEPQGEFLPLLTPDEAAKRLGISRAKVYRLMTNKQLDSVRIGGNRRVEQAALHAYVASAKDANDAHQSPR